MNRLPFTSGLVIAVMAVSLSLAGCATTKERIVYRDVIKAVPVPCKTQEPAVPDYETNKVDLTAPIFDLVKAVLIELEQRKAETTELRAANKACN